MKLKIRPPRGEGREADPIRRRPRRLRLRKSTDLTQMISQSDNKEQNHTEYALGKLGKTTEEGAAALGKSGSTASRLLKPNYRSIHYCRVNRPGAPSGGNPTDGRQRLRIKRIRARRYHVQSIRKAETTGNRHRAEQVRRRQPNPAQPIEPLRPKRQAAAEPSGASVKQRHKLSQASIKTKQNAASRAARAPYKAQSAPIKTRSNAAIKKAASTARELARERVTQKVKASAAKQTKRLSKKIGELIAKATKVVVQSIISLLGGSTLVVILVIALVVGAVLSSPFGIFFSGEDTKNQPLSVIRAEIDADFESRIQSIIDSTDHDIFEMHYEGSADGARVNNWPDVIAVFSVKTSTDPDNGMDVATLDDKRIALLNQVFSDMNTISCDTEEVDGDEPDDPRQTKLTITITGKSADEQAASYRFLPKQEEIMREFLSMEYRPLLLAILGVGGGSGITGAELEKLLRNLPDGDIGAAIVELAASRIGDPYSIPRRGIDNYTDCSHLVMWAYAQLGVTVPATASTQANFCYTNALTIDYSELQPGDLIFWSYESTDRFMSIGHVGIYAGGGMVIHASSVDLQVVCEPLFHRDKQVLYGRIHME
jgi:cell wall-associated NlpC family hydrolase